MYSDMLKHDRRLRILQGLVADSDYSLNVTVLQMLLSDYAHSVSIDVVKADLEWLREIDAVTTKALQTGLIIATATQYGIDLAKGNTTHPSIKRPTPDEIRQLS